MKSQNRNCFLKKFDKLIMAITNNLPKLIEAGIQLTVKLAVGLIKAIPQLIAQIPQIIISLVKGFANYYSNLGEVGLNNRYVLS